MKQTFLSAAILFLLGSFGTAQAEDVFVATAAVDLPEGFSVSWAQASPTSAHVAVSDGGMDFWLFDAKKQSFQHIFKNVIGDWEHHLKHTQWASRQLVLFQNWEGLIKIINPDDLSTQAIFNADLKSAPLRMSYWIETFPMLVDDTDFYLNNKGTLTKIEKSTRFAHRVQTGLIIQNNQHLITSGLHDQSIKIWSLPDGRLLQDWTISGWFTKRRITDLALSNNRLLVATQSGLLEERSLETGEKLWSSRPCQDPVDFHYSSQFAPSPSINVQDGIFFTCDTHIGYIEPQQQSWKIADVKTALQGEIAEFYDLESIDGRHKTANRLVAVETIADTDLAVLIFADGSSFVFNKQQHRVVQKLKNVKPGAAPVSYITATQQLFFADSDGRVNLYNLDKKASD